MVETGGDDRSAKGKGKGMKLIAILASLSEAPLRTCRSLHSCCLCKKDITLGDQYRDRGYGRRAHLDCMVKAYERLREVAEA